MTPARSKGTLSFTCITRNTGANLSSEKGQDAGSCPNVNDGRSLEIIPIAHDRPEVGPRARRVLEHVLLVLQHAIVVEVHVCGRRFCFAVEGVGTVMGVAVGGCRNSGLQLLAQEGKGTRVCRGEDSSACRAHLQTQ